MLPSALAVTNHRTSWIKSLLAQGKKPVMIVVEQVQYHAWKERECFWIAFYRGLGVRLVNLAEGGSGGMRPEWVTAETRKKQSLAQMGKVRDRDAIERMAEKRRGVARDASTVLKMSLAHKGKKPSQQCIEAQRKAVTGRKHTEEEKKKRAAAHIGNSYRKIHDYIAIYKNCVAFEVENLTKFCEEHGLDRARMAELAKGDPKRTQHKGWTCKLVK